jgi:hypothetical protein
MWGGRLVIQKLMDQRRVVPLVRAAQHHRHHLHQIRFRVLRPCTQFPHFLTAMTQMLPVPRVGIVIEGEHMIVIWYTCIGQQAEAQGFFLPKALGMQLLGSNGATAAVEAAGG